MRINGLPLRIAWRYLRAPKAHSAVNAIAITAVTGVAVATAAIVCVLSVFNGFRELLNERLDTLAPDVMVTPRLGKTFADGDSLATLLAEQPGVELAIPTLTDNALVIAESREMPVTLKGVDFTLYPRLTQINSLLYDKEDVAKMEPDQAVIGVGVAKRLGIYSTGVPLLVFAPKREGRVNLANPMSSFLTDSLNVSAVFQAMQSDYDENTVICDIEVARELFQYDTEAGAIEIKVKPGENASSVARNLEAFLGDGYDVKDRLQQQQLNFRMVSIEKWITFLLLIFILMIASFNIISTLCMIILDKQGSLSVYSALGMRKRSVGYTFAWESMLVALTGGVAGIIIGLFLCLAQQHFGIIKLAGDPDTMIVNAYPVVVEPSDIGLTLIPIVIIGAITAVVSSRFAISRLEIPK